MNSMNPAHAQQAQQQAQQQQQLQAALENAADVACDECENDRFVPVFVVKKISALVSPNGQEMVIPIQALKCDQCNHINELFLKPQAP